MSVQLKASYARCQSVSRRAAGNFYYSFLVLPRDKRRAMCALYAFLRHTDDLGDSAEPAEARRAKLSAWRESLAAAFDGKHPSAEWLGMSTAQPPGQHNTSDESSDAAILPAVVDMVTRYHIPREYLYDAIDGVTMDLTDRTYETFAALEEYCYKVASVVGLACIHIWGFTDRAAIEPARRLGVAFQLTNILRDLKEDAERGRVYLPQEDLQRAGYTSDDLALGVRDGRFQGLMRFEIARAEELYERGAPLEFLLSRDSRPAFRAMVGIYRGLLDEIKRRDGDVFTSRVRLSAWRKATIAACSLIARPAAMTRLGARHG